MRFICNACGTAYNLSIESMFCPCCGSPNVERTGRASALKRIERYNELVTQMSALIEQYVPLYAEATKIRNTLKVDRSRGLISDNEMPPVYKQLLSEHTQNYKRKTK